MICNKYQLQDSQYDFPYHYIPYFPSMGRPALARHLSWGLDYLCYQSHIRDKVISMEPSSVLEVGCGDGYFLGGLPSSIPVRVGVDLSQKAIAFARAFHPGLLFLCQDASLLEGNFDIVVAIEVLEHIPEEALPMFYKALRDRVARTGKVIVSIPTTVIPLNKKHYRHYTIDLLRSQLQFSNANLTVVQEEYVFFKPWWYDLFVRLSDNFLFSFELKPLMAFAWRQIWNKYRIATEKTGFHLVAVLSPI